jgi:hypothetical protein
MSMEMADLLGVAIGLVMVVLVVWGANRWVQ